MARDALLHEIEETLAREGMESVAIVPVSPQRDRTRGRIAYRVELETGRRVKARCLESEHTARDLRASRASLEEAFVRVIAQHGRVLLEEWVDGLVLGDLVQGAPTCRAGEAGALLARLHATPPCTQLLLPTYDWLGLARVELGSLGRDGILAAAEGARLDAELAAHDPAKDPLVQVHLDFCGDNMAIDSSGRLRVFDNEWFRLEPAGLDLGRTYARWPMTEDHWDRFCRSYLDAGGCDPGPLRFWQVAATLWSVALRRKRDPSALQRPLEALRSLL